MSKNSKIKAPTRIESLIIRTMIIIGILSTLNFLYFFFRPEFRGNLILYILLSVMLAYGALKKFYLWYHYFNISVPEVPKSTYRPSVDVLTTFFPGEPYEMIIDTLEAIQRMPYPHMTYLCDEANDTFLKKECERLGVVHVTRRNRINAKAGNINNALKMATGEICLILDPDHIPKPNFLNVVLPHFSNADIGYVQVVQAYYNKPHTLVARGASEQTFQFYGPMMMSMNTYGTANAIGANCTFRRAALDSIGGHAPGLAEDMHTAMLLHAKGWKSVYVPELVAKGLAPADLDSYYKQQLKWARGVFELLYTVFPEQFKNFTLRQRIHYALLPLHYLIGFIYLIGFLIPICALLFSKMPWTGDLLSFALVSLPVLLSSLAIRIFIQKWVIEKEDRGFHIIGGLLQIITWWIFILGVVYTFIRKKVPYLPTPKSEGDANWKIVIPNLVIGALSLFSIFYGLYRDFTPFSVIMAVFALMNTLFMCFSLYLASQVTNRNKILRTALERKTIERLKDVKKVVVDLADHIFIFSRFLALPLLLLTVSISIFSYYTLESSKWNFTQSKIMGDTNEKYLGVFHPTNSEGRSDLSAVQRMKTASNVDFQIVSSYIAWGDSIDNRITSEYLKEIERMGAHPMITWEPWANSFRKNDSLRIKAEKDGIFKSITDGYFDTYLKDAAAEIKKSGTTVFLRFAHEFDNPAYPWHLSEINTVERFKAAWQYVYNVFENANVDNVQWIWNPWKPSSIEATYPGSNYVDWHGVTLLDYDGLNDDGNAHSFDTLYRSFHEGFKGIAEKPVMLAEFGTLRVGETKKKWFDNAFKAIDSTYSSIDAIVFFDSSYDMNMPSRAVAHEQGALNWKINDFQAFKSPFFKKATEISQHQEILTVNNVQKPYKNIAFPIGVKGVHYKKADNWLDNNYSASRDVLLQDFAMMKRTGINTIKYSNSDVYNHNILKYAEAHDLKILFSFSIPSSLDFISDNTSLHTVKNRILKSVASLKHERSIIGWNLEGDAWSNLENLEMPNLRVQRLAYLEWLLDVTSSIKKIDAQRPLVKEIIPSRQAEAQIKSILGSGLKIDVFSLLVEDKNYESNFSSIVEQAEVPILVGGVDALQLATLPDDVLKSAVFLNNWQNQWETGSITLDGLLDFQGRKKKGFALVQEKWGKFKGQFTIPDFRILRPAIPLMADELVMYSATVFDNGNWLYATGEDDIKFEWHLVRYDAFNNIIAKKKLGNGPFIELKIPEHYNRYRLLLTAVKEGYSKTIVSELNTPM